MKVLEWMCRILVGLGFVVFALMFFIPIVPSPPPPESEVARAWIAGLAGAPGYLTLVKCVELLGGVLVLTGVALPLGLVLLAPVVINIVYFNSFLAGSPGIDLVLLASGVALGLIYRQRFVTLFSKA